MSQIIRNIAMLWTALSFAISSIAAERIPVLKPPTARNHSQLILVLAGGWNATEGKLYAFDRDPNGHWESAGINSKVVLGRNGLAWGIGLHGGRPENSICKREGDQRAPAGMFELDEIFGVAERPKLRFPYRHVTTETEAIDDPRSRFYNRLVERDKVQHKDWSSSERMLRTDDLYRWGIVVRHNWNQEAGRGSCIFLHTWIGPDVATSGCTAMTTDKLQQLIRWLDQLKRPLIVQLPVAEYRQRRTQWQLPAVR